MCLRSSYPTGLARVASACVLALVIAGGARAQESSRAVAALAYGSHAVGFLLQPVRDHSRHVGPLVDFEGRSRGGEYYGDEGILYHEGSLEGTGCIAGREVRCPLPEFLVRWHTGYEHDEDDARDVFALCEHFGIDVPEQYGKSG